MPDIARLVEVAMATIVSCVTPRWPASSSFA